MSIKIFNKAQRRIRELPLLRFTYEVRQLLQDKYFV